MLPILSSSSTCPVHEVQGRVPHQDVAVRGAVVVDGQEKRARLVAHRPQVEGAKRAGERHYRQPILIRVMVLSASNLNGWPSLAMEHASLAGRDVAVVVVVEGTKDLEELRLVDEAWRVGHQHGHAPARRTGRSRCLPR